MSALKLAAPFWRPLQRRVSGLPSMAMVLAVTLFIARTGGVAKYFMGLYLRESLGLGIDTIGWLLASYGSGMVLGSYAIGVLSDHVSPRRLAVALFVASGVALAMLVVVSVPWQLGLLLFISGVFDSGPRPINQRLIMEACTEAERPRAQALNRVAVNLAAAMAGLLGGVLAHWDYRLVFVVNSLAAFGAAAWLAWALRHLALPEAPRPSGQQPATPGSIEGELPYRDGLFMMLLAGALALGMAYEAINAMLGNYLRDYYQLGPTALGWQWAINGLLVVGLQMWLTEYSARWGFRWQLALGAALLGIGQLMLPFGSALLVVCLSTVVWTVGEMLFMPTMQILVMQRAHGRRSGHYFGMYSLVWSICALLAPIAGGQLYHHFGGHAVWMGGATVCAIALPLTFYAARRLQAA
ncbi:MFS transporter [Chitinimonas sp.]|uniref:MFS transporter n=1 Tax=Chitinimonas sp. TaxID=1934313 RepID=UPI0035AD9824